MILPCDLHLHTSFSSDSETPMEAMVQRAIELKMPTICFTEHMDYDYPPDEEGLTFLVDMPAYQEKLQQLQELYADHIEILFGLELGMQPHLSERYAALAKNYPFDYLIASQHLVDGMDPYAASFWTGREEEDVYRQYFKELYTNLQTMNGTFDTAAHLDYIVRYGPNQNRFYSYEKYADVIDPILQLLIEQDKCLEVNTAGLKYGLGHPNPAKDVLRRYRKLGGHLLTLGSDAHEPKHMGWEFPRAIQMLQELGFTSLCLFRQRVPEEISILKM